MSELKNCTVCPSADGILNEFITSLDVDTAHHRMETQKHKCGFGLKGVCCRLCANGPCKITQNSPKGVCGADANTIVASKFSSGSICRIRMLYPRS